VAGNGTAGYAGDGGAATSAELNGPNGVAVDSTGNIYIADFANNRIRKVTATTGAISTAAGNGTAGFTGDGGIATSAELNGPAGLAVDSAGNLYISDLGNNRVRAVNTGSATVTIAGISIKAGDIATVAGNGTRNYSGDGGAATSAELEPIAIAVDASGNIYIADLFSSRIREVTATTGIISTVAGNGTAGYSGDGAAATSAELNQPDGVAVDASKNIYIADHSNNRVRKVTFSTGFISTVAGNGTAGYSGDGGPPTSAELNGPGGLAVDSAGNIYISDFSNNRVRWVASTSVISTLAGNGTAGYAGDGGRATSAELNGPNGLSLDTAGNIYIADYGNSRIRAVAPLSIAYLSPSAGAIASSVMISGIGFGPIQGPSTVTFNGTAATSISNWSANLIVAAVPTGATTGNVVVTVGGAATNGAAFTVVVAPSITNLSTTSGAPGTSVTITGTNFGSSQGTSAVLFNGAAGTPTSWNATTIVVPVPANAGTGPVVVVVNGLQSNGITFTDTSAPIITSISPTSGKAATSVTINGSLFGASQGSSTVTFNGVVTGTPTSWSAAKIVVPAPSGVTTGNVVVTVNGIPSNGEQFVVTPTITSLSPTSGGIGTAVTIIGTNFGSTQGTSTVKFNTTAATPLNWNPTSIVVPVPAGATTGTVVVTIGGVASNGISFTVTSAPGITSISPPSGNAGTKVTINGIGFGSTQGTSTLTFNGVTAPVSSWSATAIQAQVPAGGVPGPVVITVAGILSDAFPYSLPSGGPTITGLSFTQGPPQMGIVITGTGFAANGANQVTVGGTNVPIITFTSTTSITVQIPAGAALGNADVIVLAGPGPEYVPSNAFPFNVTNIFGCSLP
jgi:sugar lactone lactonase YvrE